MGVGFCMVFGRCGVMATKIAPGRLQNVQFRPFIPRRWQKVQVPMFVWVGDGFLGVSWKVRSR